MAFLPQQDDQTQNQTTNTQSQIPAIPTLQGSGGPSTSSSSGTQGGTTNTASSPGSAPTAPWQNITTYLQANAAQSGDVANKLAGNLQNQYNTTNQAIADTSQNFTNQVNAGSVNEDKGMLQTASQNPGQFVQDPNNLSAFQKQYNATYTGPQDFSHTSDFSNLQGKVLDAQKNAALANQGTSGIETLLGSNGANNSQGVRDLDTLLLQEDPNNIARIQKAAAPFSTLTSSLQQQQSALDQAAQNAQQATAQTAQDYQKAFTGPTGVLPTWQQNLIANQQRANQQTQDYNQKLGSEVSDAQRADAALKAFELNTGGNYTDPFSNIIGMSPVVTPPTLENTATANDFAEQQALSEMLGQNVNVLNPQLANQAGTFQAPTASLPSLSDAVYNVENTISRSPSRPTTNSSLPWWNLVNALQNFNPQIHTVGNPASGTYGTTEG